MWVGEQITERGIGNGISLIIFAGIVTDIPSGVFDYFADAQGRHPAAEPSRSASGRHPATIATIVFFERGQRQHPDLLRARTSADGSTAGRPRTCRSR